MTVWSIDLCDGFAKLGEVEAFSRFNAVVKLLAVGGWRLEASTAGLGGVDLSAVDSIIVRRDSQLVFPGLVRPAGNGPGGAQITDDTDGQRVVLEGSDLWGVLASRVAFPDPVTYEPWSSAHDVRTGVASTVAAAYVYANIGVSALAARQVSGLTVTDSVVGASGTWSARLQRLDELVARICTEGGLVCRPTITSAGAIVIQFLSPVDRSTTMILSDQGDLIGTVRSVRPASATWVLGAGQGELTARAFQSSPSSVTGLDRVEVVYDNTNITTTAELLRAAIAEQAQRAAATTVSTRVAVGAAQRFEYLTDYDIGDTVAVELENVRYPAQVSAVAIELTPGVAVVSPMLGPTPPDRLTGLFRDVDQLSSRLDRQLA